MKTAIAALLAGSGMILSLSCQPSGPAEVASEEPAPPRLGAVAFHVTCEPGAQVRFKTGLARLHHMMYVQAANDFRAAAEADPGCAMAFWGIAMTQFHPLWPGLPDESALARGDEAIARARSLDPPNRREKAFIDAAAAFYEDRGRLDHAARLGAWEEAQREVHENWPEDVDAAALYALAHLATAPRSDKTFAHQREAGALLERLFRTAPGHPGVIHYLIHAYDNPILASRAVDAARAYDGIAPEVPHALHMPTHIFVRLGLWSDVIGWNTRSAAAALRQPAGGRISLHYPHAVDYLVYAYLQESRDLKAREVLDELHARKNFQDDFAAAYALAAAPARYHLERMKWGDAARLPVRRHASIEWDRYPEVEAITYFARGLGAARNRDLAAARTALRKLDQLHAAVSRAYWAAQVDVQRKAVAAWIAFAEGKSDDALSTMSRAADLEDSLDKDPVTPGNVLPARELYGDMLAALERHDEAIQAYKTSLETSPNRFNSLYGAGRSAELGGYIHLADSYYSKLDRLTDKADTQRTRLEKVKTFLAQK